MMQFNVNNTANTVRQAFSQMYQYSEVPAVLLNAGGVVEEFNNQFLLKFHNGIIEQGKTTIDEVFDISKEEITELQDFLKTPMAIHTMKIKSAVKLFSGIYFELILTPINSNNHWIGQLNTGEIQTKKILPNYNEFQTLAENSNDFMCLMDEDFNFIYTSPAITRILGYHRNEMVGRNVMDILHPDDFARYERISNTLIKNRSFVPTNYRVKHKNGHYVWIETSHQIAEATPRHSMRIIAISRDISERMTAWKAQLAAEEALLTSETRYKILTEVTSEGIIIHKNLVVQDTNPSIQRMIGLNESNLKGTYLLDFINKAYRKEVIERVNNNIKEKYNIELIRADGSTFPAEITAKNLIINDETYRVASVVDITQRVADEKKIKESEERFRSIFQNTIAGIAIANTDGYIIHSNKAFNEALGYNEEEMNGKSFCDTIICENKRTCESISIKCLREHETNGYIEKKFIRKDGQIAWVNLSVSSIPQTDHSQACISVVIQDITVKKKNELDLIKALEYNKTINQTSPVGIITTNHKGTISFANQRAEQILGLLRSTSPTHNYYPQKWHFVTIDGKYYPPELYPINIIKATRKPINSLQQAIEWPDGTRCCLSVNAAPIIYKNELKGMIATLEDITKKVKTEQELLESNEKLKDLNATKDKFFSIIAHDLRSPLANVFSLSDLLHKNYKEYDQETTGELIQLLHDNSSRTFTLLDNLLTWSRSQCEKLTFTPQKISLHQIVEETTILLKGGFGQKNISLINSIQKNIEVNADHAMLSSVLRNLISNAIKFSHPGGVVEIKSLQDDSSGFVKFVIIDQGIGMSEEVKTNLFKIGLNASIPGTMGEQGTGLGLMLCKEFVEKHNGKIWIESNPNEGCSFFITLPLGTTKEPQASEYTYKQST